ncbi:MAG: hypothetical protein HC838_00165 [Spirulinaceae cyanobacterium RM2_2_10]|nr:hypothetical protein [Spirulinaceae cyanobacterium RM2_2_10]
MKTLILTALIACLYGCSSAPIRETEFKITGKVSEEPYIDDCDPDDEELCIVKKITYENGYELYRKNGDLAAQFKNGQ